ncbi:MAG: hypothetical protein Q8888_01175, partial [Vigna little leaf phytoplasma]|nr:hypothetical protein [Vigna little leaf phytoplasma]
MSRKISKKYFNFKVIVFVILIFTNFIGLVLFSKANMKIQSLSELSTVLTTTDLGEIQNQQDSTIKEAITSKNASLQGKNVSLSNI